MSICRRHLEQAMAIQRGEVPVEQEDGEITNAGKRQKIDPILNNQTGGFEDDEVIKNLLYRKPAKSSVLIGMRDYSIALISKETLADFEPGRRSCYNLHKIKSYGEVDHLGHFTFAHLSERITERRIGNLMLLAYNLRDNEDNEIYSDVPYELISLSELYEFDEMSDEILDSTKPYYRIFCNIAGNDEESVRIRAIGFCYLALSFMKLYCKSSTNYVKISDHLAKRYPNFFKIPFPFGPFHPKLETVDIIKNMLERKYTPQEHFL